MVLPHIGVPETILILAIILIVFGVGKLPQVGGAIGKGLRAFRKAQSGEELEEEEELEEKPRKRTTTKAAKKKSTTKSEGT